MNGLDFRIISTTITVIIVIIIVSFISYLTLRKDARYRANQSLVAFFLSTIIASTIQMIYLYFTNENLIRIFAIITVFIMNIAYFFILLTIIIIYKGSKYLFSDISVIILIITFIIANTLHAMVGYSGGVWVVDDISIVFVPKLECVLASNQ